MSFQDALNLYENGGSGRIASWTDALSIGIEGTIIGLIIVFGVLIILMFVLYAMAFVFAPKEAKAKAEAAPAAIPAPAKAPEAVAVSEAEDEELIAAITAAVAASLNTSTYNLKIKSFKRVANAAPAWNKAGLNETINSRF